VQLSRSRATGTLKPDSASCSVIQLAAVAAIVASRFDTKNRIDLRDANGQSTSTATENLRSEPREWQAKQQSGQRKRKEEREEKTKRKTKQKDEGQR